MAHPFLEASTWIRSETASSTAAARFTTTPVPAWFQGKGAFGGLLAGGVLRAMMSVVDAPVRRPRTLHMHFCAPARAAPLIADVVVERTGSSVSVLSARLTQDDAVVCVATATFAAPRPRPDDNARYLDDAPPSVPRPADVEPVPADLPLLPVFTQFFEYRFCVGDLPYSGGSRSLLGGWLRFREPLVLDAPAVAALADALPPAVFTRLSEPRAASSVDFTMDFFDDPSASTQGPTDPAGSVLVVQRSRRGDGGTTDEHCDVWSEDGRLLCAVRQLVALL